MRNLWLFSTIMAGLLACQTSPTDKDSNKFIRYSSQAPTIDGKGDDACWKKVKPQLMDQIWVGKLAHASDYMGKFKIRWDEQFLYILAEIYDDTLVDTHKNGLEKYWDDDCLEIFVDEDGSGGNHQYNYNAFAYHISLDSQFVDMGTDSLPHFYKDHGSVAIRQNDKVTTWEVALRLFPDTYKDNSKNIPVLLKEGKKIGFAIAYNDNDKSVERENMMANIDVTPKPDKNRGWIDAGVFSKMELKK